MLVLRKLPTRLVRSTRAYSVLAPPSSPEPQDLLSRYRSEVDSGRLQWQDDQARTIVQLRHVHRRLSSYTPNPLLLSTPPPLPLPQAPQRTLSFWPFKPTPQPFDPDGLELVRIRTIEEELREIDAPRGVLLTGPPGTGKTKLVQMLYDAVPTERKVKRHYHSFLLQIYHLLHLESTSLKPSGSYSVSASERGYEGWRKEDELAFKVAKRLIEDEGWLILFDELQLSDIATASILQSVLLHFFRLGGVLLSTSNRLPSDLYGGGVQKKRIESFLECLKGRCEVLELDGGRDWRAREGGAEGEEGGRWEVDDGFEGRKRWTSKWKEVTHGEEVQPQTIVIYNRPLVIARQTGVAGDLPSSRVAHFTFVDLCENALGTADFLSICSTYGTIFLSDVPALTLNKKNEARRFINLIDAMYEHRTHLHVLSTVPLSDLFFPDASSSYSGPSLIESLEEEALSEMLKEVDEPTRPNVSVYAVREKRQRKEGVVAKMKERGERDFRELSIYSGEDEKFAFKRALSRLQEMTNPTLVRQPHVPLCPSLRTWETSTTSSSSGTSSVPTPDRKRFSDKQGDFAEEASFLQRTGGGGGGPRENATKLRSEAHFWGLVTPKDS